MTANELEGRILLAEDVADNQRLMALYLTRAGAEVTVAADGRATVAAALESRAERRAFALILMDMQMPGLDGLMATGQLRAAAWKGPIVALTANAGPDDRARCLGAGCDDYLTKPVDKVELIRACSTWMRVGRTIGA